MAIHEEAPYAESGERLPHTVAASRETLMLPLFPGLEEQQQDYVIEHLEAHLAALVV
jgi:dTDP-4-amino-4,6-dideoxygalactose transaminase